MEFICFVKKENVMKADNALREDFNLASKQSITVRDAKALGLEDDGSFFYITGTDEGVEKCKELLKDFIGESDKLEEAKKKILEEGDAAASGIGGLFD